MSDFSDMSGRGMDMPPLPPGTGYGRGLGDLSMAPDLSFSPHQASAEEALPERQPDEVDLAISEAAGSLATPQSLEPVDASEASPTQIVEVGPLQETNKREDTPLSSYERNAARERTLEQLVAPDPALVAEHRPKLWAAASQVAGLTLNPEQQRAIQLFAGITDWQMFGGPEDAPPQGLVPSRDGVGYVVDERIPYLLRSPEMEAVQEQLYGRGLREITDTVTEALHNKDSEISEIAKAHIAESEVHRFLMSFDVQRPAPEDQPLNPYWRTVFATPLQEQLAAAEPHSVAADRLQRQLSRLDEETMPGPAEPRPHEEGLLRAREHFTAEVAAAYISDVASVFPSRQFKGLVYDESYEELCVRYSPSMLGEEQIDVAFAFIETVASRLHEELWTGSEKLKSVTFDYLTDAIERIVDPRTTGSLREVLADVANKRAQAYAHTLAYATGERWEAVRYQTGLIDIAQMEKDQNDGAYWLQEELAPYEGHEAAIESWVNVFDSRPKLLSAYEIERQNYEVAAVLKYEPQDLRTTARLVQERALLTGLPEADPGKEKLVLDYYIPLPVGRMSHVVGYVPVSASVDGTRFGFAPDPEGDPYYSCDVPVPEQGRAVLAETYRQMGLTELAETISAGSVLTVDQLTAATWNASEYFIPDSSVDPDDDSPALFSLPEYQRYVQNGRLQAQCTVSANFLRLSLNLVFGEGAASIAGGRILGAYAAGIHAIEHAQTVFVHGGHQYVLDAAPPLPFNRFSGSLPPATIAGVHQPARTPHFEPLPTSHTPVQERPVLSREERLRQQFTALNKWLQVALGVPTPETLKEHIVRLPSHDPVRLTYELAYQSVQGILRPEDAGQALNVVRRLTQAEPDIRNSLQYGQYEELLLAQLYEVATNVVGTVAPSVSE